MSTVTLGKSVLFGAVVIVTALCFMYGSMQKQFNWNSNMAVDRKSRRLPNALIIGVRKAGTRALLEFLNLHPQIRTSGPECHFFDREENYAKGLRWYRQKMPRSLPGDITMEKTPAYFVTDQAPARIYEMSKNVKLIVIVRDPTTRAISDYTQIKEKIPALAPFEKLVTSDKEEKVINKNSKYVQKGLYISHLRKWIKYFPLNQIHFVSGEEIVRNPAAEVKAVEAFLNLDHLITEEAFYINDTKGFPCAKKDGNKNGCLGKGKGREHPKVRKDVVTMLQNYYRPFNEELYRTVQRNFSWP